MQLYEKYRPAALADYVGHAVTVKALDGMMSSASWDRDVLWFSGASGVGKTTLARLVAQRVLSGKDLKRNLAVLEVSGEQVDLAFVGGMAYEVGLSSPDPSGWRVWLINEGQQVTPNARRALKTVLEGLPPRRLLLFTSTKGPASGLFGNMDEDEARQLWSRVKFFDLDDGEDWLAEAAARARAVAATEGLNGQPPNVYLALARECKGNLREMLQRVEMRNLPAGAWQGTEHLAAHVKEKETEARPPERPEERRQVWTTVKREDNVRMEHRASEILDAAGGSCRQWKPVESWWVGHIARAGTPLGETYHTLSEAEAAFLTAVADSKARKEVQRAARAGDQKVAVRTNGENSDGERGARILGPLTHTKKGFLYWLVVPAVKVDKDAWLVNVERAKVSGGWYSSAWAGTPGGYAFKEQAKAEAFAKTI